MMAYLRDCLICGVTFCQDLCPDCEVAVGDMDVHEMTESDKSLALARSRARSLKRSQDHFEKVVAWLAGSRKSALASTLRF